MSVTSDNKMSLFSTLSIPHVCQVLGRVAIEWLANYSYLLVDIIYIAIASYRCTEDIA